MRTIQETIASGIHSLADLQDALLTAIQLEFSTIPLYLCAQWSINPSGDPSGVSGMIQGVAVQEMLHFGYACNMYTATGGSLTGKIATAGFVPVYPGPLPAGVHPGLTVSLEPVGLPSLQTFMDIEYPETAIAVPEPSTPPPPTPPVQPSIGEFYDTIAAGFNTVFPGGQLPGPIQNQVATSVGSDELTAIGDVADAINAINLIKDQGEGTSVSPDEGTFDPNNLAHYYTFSQIYFGKLIVAAAGGGFEYSDSPADQITMPTAYNFTPQPNNPNQAAFIASFSSLLTELEQCWTAGASIDDAIGNMFPLQTEGTNLIQAGAAPQFVFQSQSVSSR